MTTPIRIALVGTGIFASLRHWPALATLQSEFEVVALCNRTASKAEALAAKIAGDTGRKLPVYTDYRRLFEREELDAVSLLLPPALNPEVAEAALAAGYHVIAEKPIAANLADANRMLPWPARYGRTFMIAENFRYLPGFRRGARMVAEGAIGKPVQTQWFLFPYVAPDNPYALTSWRQNPVHPGGFLSDSGVHDMAALRSILGEAATVQARVTSVRPDLKPVDTLAVVVEWANGALGTYQATHAVRGPHSPLMVVGTEGSLAITRLTVEWRQGDQVAGQWEEPDVHDGAVAMYTDFAGAIRAGRPPLSTPVEARADLQLIMAMLRAAETGERVRVADVTE